MTSTPHMSEAHEADAARKNDHVIEALTSDRADQSFSIAVLPRRSRRCRSVANAHRANAARKRVAVSTVAITNKVLWRHIPAAGFGDLLSNPFGSRTGRDAAGRSRRCHLHDLEGTSSSLATEVAFVAPCTLQP